MSPGVDLRNAPLFFLSYARAKDAGSGVRTPTTPNPEVSDFYSDVLNQLRQLTPHQAGERLGFIDLNVETGRTWEPALLHALGTCRVFLALLSPPYLNGSEWCAMEWDLFSGRRVVEKVGDEVRTVEGAGILPVLWTPIPHRLPPRVEAVQWFIPAGLPPDYVALYLEEGVLGLLSLNHDAYKAVVWKVAREIDRIARLHQPQPVDRKDTVGLRRSFEEGGR